MFSLSSPIKTEGCAETKFDWELASQALIEKKEQQERYLKDLKEQILIKKKSKEFESERISKKKSKIMKHKNVIIKLGIWEV